MSDHGIYCKNYTSTEISACEEIGGFNDDSESVIEEEKSGDEFLIELYRERPFLYDKKDPNFKNTLMRENGWNEISKIMIATNSGDIYTPQYCQKRCTSLREQYNREKKRRESQFKSGNAAPNSNSRQFSFYSHLTFLDQVIKRRRTYSNARSQASASFVEKNKAETEIYESDNTSTCSSINKENTSTDYKYNIENSHQDVLQNSSKFKKRKMNETKELEQTFLNISNSIMNYMETSNSKQCTPDDAFIEFIKVQFNNIPEHEKNIRRKMIMDAISTPLNM